MQETYTKVREVNVSSDPPESSTFEVCAQTEEREGREREKKILLGISKEHEALIILYSNYVSLRENMSGSRSLTEK